MKRIRPNLDQNKWFQPSESGFRILLKNTHPALYGLQGLQIRFFFISGLKIFLHNYYYFLIIKHYVKKYLGEMLFSLLCSIRIQETMLWIRIHSPRSKEPALDLTLFHCSRRGMGSRSWSSTASKSHVERFGAAVLINRELTWQTNPPEMNELGVSFNVSCLGAAVSINRELTWQTDPPEMN